MSPRDIQSLRASDADREAVVALLGDSHEDGRLSLEEMKQRVDAAYRATTIGQLKTLLRDLPLNRREQKSEAETKRRKGGGRLQYSELSSGQKALRVLWTIWTAVVSINLVVWVLASISSGEALYFWPAWVAGPTGAALGSITWFTRGNGGPRKNEDPDPMW